MSSYWRNQIPPYGSPAGDFHSEVDARDRFWRQSIINRYGDDARNPAVSVPRVVDGFDIRYLLI